MYGRRVILYFMTYGILSTYPVCAQDTVALEERVRTERSTVVQLIDRHYGSPALKRLLRNWNVSSIDAGHRYEAHDLFIYQQGSGYRQLGVNVESLRQTPKGTLWGEAQYQNKRTVGINYSESMDYEVIAPYVMADTVGGTLQTERYAFSGGYAWRRGRWDYGAEAGFRGDQGYRNRDPRLNAVVADIDATVAAAIALTSRYQLAAHLGGRRYRQVNRLGFVNEVGQPLVYHDAGLGVYNMLLAGTRTEAYYTGYAWCPAIFLVPRDRRGWFANISYSSFLLHKELENILDPIAKIKTRTWVGSAGYAGIWGNGHLYMGVSGRVQQRDGYEARFNNRDVGKGMSKIDESLRYIDGSRSVALDAAFEHDGVSVRWAIAGTGGYMYDDMSYTSPQRRMEIGYLHGGARLSATKSWSTLWLTAQLGYGHRTPTFRISEWADVNPDWGIYKMLNGNFAYLASGQRLWQTALRIDVQVGPALVGFLNINGQRTHYDAGRQGSLLGVNVGFLF